MQSLLYLVLGVVPGLLAGCAALQGELQQGDQEVANQVFHSQPVTQDDQAERQSTADLFSLTNRPTVATDSGVSVQQSDSLSVLLQNEFGMRRDRYDMQFTACRKAAIREQNYDLAHHCMHQARELRDHSNDLAFAHLLVELMPEHPPAYNELAQSYINSTAYIKALEILNTSDDLGFAPDLAVPGIRAVFLYGDDMQGLINRYSDYVELKPHRLRLLIGKAVLLIRRMEQFYFIGRYHQTLAATKDILALSRHQAFTKKENSQTLDLENVYVTYARSLVQLGRVQEAADRLAAISREHPEYLEMQLELLGIYLQEEQYTQAEQLAIALLRANQLQEGSVLRIGLQVMDSPITTVRDMVNKYFLDLSKYAPTAGQRELALYRLSQLEGVLGNTAAQIGYLQGIQQTDDLILLSVRQQAELIGQEQSAQAVRAFYALQESRFPALAPRMQLTQAYWLSNIDRAQAVGYVTTLLEQRSDDQELLYIRGFLHALEGDVAAMEQDFTKILELNPFHVDTLNSYGYTLVDQTDRTEEGLELIGRAFALESERPAIVDSMAWGYFRRGENRRALVLIQWAYARNQDAEIAAHYGEILWTLGYKSEARELLDRDRREHPENSVLQDTWQRLFGS